jgi:type II secretory pathway component PulF
MTLFRYSGRDQAGDICTGELNAASLDAARTALANRGIEVTEITELPPEAADSAMSDLTPAEKSVVDGQVRNLIAGGLPLAEGLRAAAAEFEEPGLWAKLSPFSWLKSLLFRTNEKRIRQALLKIAGQVEAGTSIEEALSRRAAPNEIKAVLSSGISSESAAMAIGEYSGYAEISSRLRGQVLFLFAYPLVSLVAGIAIIGIVFCMLVPTAKKAFEDFSVELPAMTQAVLAVSDVLSGIGIVTVIGVPLLLVGALLVFFLFGGPLANRVAGMIPVIGPGFRYLSMARIGHVLAVVLRHNASVPGALRAAGMVSGRKSTAAACVAMAESVETGEGLPDSHSELRGLPLSFLHIAGDESDRDTIADGLHSLATMFEQRARAIMAMLAGVVQPLLIIALAMMVVVCFYALFLPFIKLLNDLA